MSFLLHTERLYADITAKRATYSLWASRKGILSLRILVLLILSYSDLQFLCPSSCCLAATYESSLYKQFCDLINCQPRRLYLNTITKVIVWFGMCHHIQNCSTTLSIFRWVSTPMPVWRLWTVTNTDQIQQKGWPSTNVWLSGEQLRTYDGHTRTTWDTWCWLWVVVRFSQW